LSGERQRLGSKWISLDLRQSDKAALLKITLNLTYKINLNFYNQDSLR
jgi:hypothetical protein